MIDRNKLNSLKDYVMMSMRFCEQVADNGFESYEQFQAFNQMCANHVDMCNTWLKRIKPMIPCIQYKKYKLYKELHYTCAYTVDCINEIIAEWDKRFAEAQEEAKQRDLLIKRCKIEHEIAAQYSEKVYETAKSYDRKKKPIGFVTSANSKSKRKYTRKKEDRNR